MTKRFDDEAREALLAVYTKPDLSDIHPAELDIRPIDCRQARGYIAAFHYSKTMPDSSRFIYGLFNKDMLCGICVFGMGAGKNQYTAICPDIKNGEYIELTRLWLEDTLRRNTESYFISRCLKMLPKEIKMVISFSDEKQNHFGYIYQATNFLYLGKNGGGECSLLRTAQKNTRDYSVYTESGTPNYGLCKTPI